MMELALRCASRSILLALLMWAPASLADVQELSFPRAQAWYFVSLQVQPANPDPLAVFPTSVDFQYEHVWAFDPIDGWRHFSPPDAGLPDLLNDLDRIEALRGYWILVTRVPPGGARLPVSGDRVYAQRLEGAGWHAVGPLLAPSAAPANVSTVFADLGPGLAASLAEFWRYDAASDSFLELTDASASCGAVPGQCMAPGEGYWVRSLVDVVVGTELRISPEAFLLSPDEPVKLLRLSVSGAGGFAGRLRAEPGGGGVRFLAARENRIDEQLVPAPDPNASGADGPDLEADLDRDGVPEPCPDLCAGLADCVNLCFSSAGRVHYLYATFDLGAFAALDEFSSLEPGREFARLVVEEAAGDPRSVARLAVKPPIVKGRYVGTLFYEEPQAGSVPFQLILDDCTVPPGGGEPDCAGDRLTGVVNPDLLGSSGNGFDDDGDGAVDEPDEEGSVVGIRAGAAFADAMVLRGKISSDNRFLRLGGKASALPGLGFAAAGQCAGGECADGSGRCSVDADCPRDAGLAFAFGAASRELSLQGERTEPTVFTGTFADRFEGTAVDGAQVSSRGRFALARIAAPQCVAPSSTPGSPPLPLDIGCRRDEDCPSRCSGDLDFEGFPCDPLSPSCGTGSCVPFDCAFVELAGSSASALEHAPVNAQVEFGIDLGDWSDWDVPIVEVVGVDGAMAQIALAGAAHPCSFSAVLQCRDGVADFSSLPCGSYTFRVSTPSCTGSSAPFDVCGVDPVELELYCFELPPPRPAVAATLTPLDGSGGIALRGGTSTAAPAGPSPLPPRLASTVPGDPLRLGVVAGEAGLAGREPGRLWTNVLEWLPLPERLRVGLLALTDAGEAAP